MKIFFLNRCGVRFKVQVIGRQVDVSTGKYSARAVCNNVDEFKEGLGVELALKRCFVKMYDDYHNVIEKTVRSLRSHLNQVKLGVQSCNSRLTKNGYQFRQRIKWSKE